MEPITEDYVSFEVAKLLKEKGFDEASYRYYDDEKLCFFALPTNDSKLRKELKASMDKNDHLFDSICVAPTQALVIKWLRIKHNIHISVDFDLGHLWSYALYSLDGVVGTLVNSEFKTPEEAIEAAILYCLQNLIK